MSLVKNIALTGCLLAFATPVLATPVMAAGAYDTQGAYRSQLGSPIVHRMRAQDFDHFDFGIARPRYHSGWGGPYGDGDYPGTVDQNMGPPYWGR